MIFLLLEGGLLVGGWCPMTFSWKVVRTPGFLLRRAGEVVVELAISKVEEKLKVVLTLWRGSEKKVSFRSVWGPSW
jgi:hypothetical protein